jgi:oligogalacturonide lyase
MTRGETHPPEAATTTDRRTGATIRQVTDHRSINHHPFFTVTAYDDDMDWLVFVSHRTGRPEVFGERRETGELVQFTENGDLNEWSINPSPDGDYVYFTAGTRACRVSTESYETEVLADFGDVPMTGEGMVGAAMGTNALSPSGRWWAVPYSVGERSRLAVVDTQSGDWTDVLERDTIGHPQFCPDDPSLLFYAGPLTDRVWLVNRDGSGNRRLYEREPGEWITHETWVPGRRELAFVDWPNGMRAVDVDTGAERRVTDCNAWHAAASPDGTRMVADTNFPDVGLQLFDPRDGVAKTRTLCYPAASSIGEHWDGPFPYADGPVDVYAPQHTHPHPSFAPGADRVVYTSDRSGFAQVYEVELPRA